MPITKLIYHTLYNLELQTVGIIIGAVVLIGHLVALLQANKVRPWLQKMPRNYPFGAVLMTLNFIWVFIIWTEMDLGEFYRIERSIQLVIIIAYFAVVFFVTEFLAARAVGMFLILLAAPVLDSAFLEMPDTRLLLVLLAYVGAVAGMFFVGMPYLLRDGIDWVSARTERWKGASLAGAVYGALVLVCALMFYKAG